MEKPDKISLFTYLSLFYEFFSDVEPPEPLVTREGGNKKKAGSRMTPLKRKLVYIISGHRFRTSFHIVLLLSVLCMALL